MTRQAPARLRQHSLTERGPGARAACRRRRRPAPQCLRSAAPRRGRVAARCVDAPPRRPATSCPSSSRARPPPRTAAPGRAADVVGVPVRVQPEPPREAPAPRRRAVVADATRATSGTPPCSSWWRAKPIAALVRELALQSQLVARDDGPLDAARGARIAQPAGQPRAPAGRAARPPATPSA